MMRSLWTAASGMKAQQTSLDIISNNLSNINTTRPLSGETAPLNSLPRIAGVTSPRSL